MSHIRFACPKCGQHLACEASSQGTPIVCPACKQTVLVVTEEIRACYRLLELEPGAPLNEVKQAHRERIKHWDPDLFPKDPGFRATAGQKAKELDAALRTIAAYLAGKYTQSPAGAKASEEETRLPGEGPRPDQDKGRPERSGPETSAPRGASHHLGGTGMWRVRWLMPWMFLGLGVAVAAVLLGGLVPGLLDRKGPALTPESTGASWIRASERAKRACCRAILIEMEHKGFLRKFRVRANEDFFYDGLESLCRSPGPEDLNSRLDDLSAKLLSNGHQAPSPP